MFYSLQDIKVLATNLLLKEREHNKKLVISNKYYSYTNENMGSLEYIQDTKHTRKEYYVNYIFNYNIRSDDDNVYKLYKITNFETYTENEKPQKEHNEIEIATFYKLNHFEDKYTDDYETYKKAMETHISRYEKKNYLDNEYKSRYTKSCRIIRDITPNINGSLYLKLYNRVVENCIKFKFGNPIKCEFYSYAPSPNNRQLHLYLVYEYRKQQTFLLLIDKAFEK